MEITNINKETSLLHPSAHEFWEEEEIRKSLLDFLVSWSRNPLAYAKKTQTPQDEATAALKRDKNDEGALIEMEFVDGLFEMFKLRKDIAKARTELIAMSVLSGY